MSEQRKRGPQKTVPLGEPLQIKTFRVEGPILPAEAETTFYIERKGLVDNLLNWVGDARNQHNSVLIEGSRMGGKTTAIYYLTERLRQNDTHFILLSPKERFKDGEQDTILKQLWESAKASDTRLFEAFNSVQKALDLPPNRKRKLFLLVDDADRLPPSLLEEVLLKPRETGSTTVVLFATAMRDEGTNVQAARARGLSLSTLLPFDVNEAGELLFQFIAIEAAMAKEVHAESGGHPGLVGAFGGALQQLADRRELSDGLISLAWSKVADGPVCKAMIENLVQHDLEGEDDLSKKTPLDPKRGDKGVNLLRRLVVETDPVKLSFPSEAPRMLVSLGFAQRVWRDGEPTDRFRIRSEQLRRMIRIPIFNILPKIDFEVPTLEGGGLDFVHFLCLAIKLFDSNAISSCEGHPKERIYHEQFSFALLRWFHQKPEWKVFSEFVTREGENESLDFLIIERGTYQAGVEFLKEECRKNIREHAGRTFPGDVALDDYVVVDFQPYDRPEDVTNRVYDNLDFFWTSSGFVDKATGNPKKVPIFYVFYLQDFTKAALVCADQATGGRKVVHFLGSPA